MQSGRAVFSDAFKYTLCRSWHFTLVDTCRISMNMDEYGARGYLLLRNRKDSNYVWRHVSLRMLTRKRCGHADQQLFDASLLVLLLQRPDLKIPPHYSG